VRTILIVDDHPMMRRGLRELLSHEPDLRVCGEAVEAQAALRMIESLPPDLMIVDLSLKQSSGLDLIKRVRATHPEVRMLVISMHDEGLYAERALSAGAMGYVSKQEPPEGVLDAVRLVLRGEVYLSPEMTARRLRQMTPREQHEFRSPVEKLSDRELEVFEAIGIGRSTRQIADQLHVSVKTIETHRENIKRKLGLSGNIELIQRSCRWILEEK
jgi:DNA-binding NarL/FixJ family response regulator